MLPIKRIVVNKMQKITLVMVAIILVISTVVQIFSARNEEKGNAEEIFLQVEQILEENAKELEQIQKEYEATCINDARTVAYILEYNPTAKSSVEELKKIAANAEVDEIHIFDAEGTIVAGTHPEYIGLSFDSGEQMRFFKPLLTDKSLEMVQGIEPNTAEGKLVQYSAIWSEDRNFILQIGMYPVNVLRITKKNELSYIFSLLRTGVGYNLYAVNPEDGKVVGVTALSDVEKDISAVGFPAEKLKEDGTFHAKVNGVVSYCLSKKIDGNYIIWTRPVAGFFRSILINDVLLLGGLFLIAFILVYAVSNIMNKAVIGQIKVINNNLSAIQAGDLQTKVNVNDSKEFLELSDHINKMVESLLESSEKLELSEKVRLQKEELERQHEQLEIAAARAEAANQAKSVFLFNMSHDIRTPMNAILGFTKLALESEDPEEQNEYLKNIDISSKQLLDLVNNILELSKIENHKIVIEEELADIRETHRKLRTVFDNDLKEKRLTYTVNQDIEHPYLYIDTAHYSQIFLNIVSNAIKYTPNGGSITVSLRERAGDDADTCIMETTVEDNGIGMSSEFLGQAYDLFSRERNSTISGIYGTGLGLAIVKNLVELMRGTIAIESRQGVGTKVTICIPHRLGESLDAEQSREAEMPDTAPLAGKRILLAEDVDVNAMITTKLLTGRGCLVDRARDGVECVDMLLKAEKGYYDLVLMDIMMPNMDGYRAAETIREFSDKEKASIPILAMTANAFQEDCEKAFEAGMNDHIAKPLNAAKMFRSIIAAVR